jgi:Tfp pilus assembly protein PilW
LRRADGFTLAEALMGVAIGSIIMAGVLSSYIMGVRQFRALANYWEIHSDGRYAVDRFTGDIRSVYDVTSYASNGPLVVKIPYFNSGGVVTGSTTVTYSFTGGALKRTVSSPASTSVLATNVYDLKFFLYDRVGNPTTVLSTSKGVVIEIFLRKYTAGQKQSEDFLSARVNMRNKP